MTGGTGERAEAAALDRRILELIDGARATWSVADAALNALALDIFAYQCRHLPAYGRFAAARGAAPGRIGDWRRVPPVPARAFKKLRMATFAEEHRRRRFRSSGTTGRERALLELDTLALYDAALVPTMQRFLFPDGARLRWLALVPDPAAAGDSSLAYMVGRAAAELAAGVRFLVANDELDLAAMIAELTAAAARAEPVCLLGTAFAFVHLVETLAASGAAARATALAPGSRIMETGGFKGRSREVARAELYRRLGDALAVPAAAIVAEYGMTEMGSQFYDDSLRRRLLQAPRDDAGGAPAVALDDPAARRLKHGPPWVRTRVLDPATLAPVADGEEGVLSHLDLTGRGSALVLLTEDRGRRAGDAFELLGRQPGAEPRGCSLVAEEYSRHVAESR